MSLEIWPSSFSPWWTPINRHLCVFSSGLSLSLSLFFFFLFLIFFFTLFFNFTILYWFCHISTWICHRYTRVPHPEPSSLLPPHTIPLGRPSAPAPSIQYYASNLDWWLVSYMILHMFILEISFTTVCIPRFLGTIITRDKTISYNDYTAQLFFFIFLGITEFYLLTAMSYDRYVAICKPLHYTTIMNNRVCVLLIFCAWLAGFWNIFPPVIVSPVRLLWF